MVCLELLRYFFGQGTFVERLFSESDCKGLHRRFAFLHHCRDHARRIQASTKESTKWNVATHPDLYRVVKVSLELREDVFCVCTHFGLVKNWKIPVGAFLHLSIPHQQELARH